MCAPLYCRVHRDWHPFGITCADGWLIYTPVSPQVLLGLLGSLQRVSSHVAHMLINIHHMAPHSLQILCQDPLGLTHPDISIISIYTQLVWYSACPAVQRVRRLTVAAAGRSSLLGIQEPSHVDPQMVNTHLMLYGVPAVLQLNLIFSHVEFKSEIMIENFFF